MKTWVLGLLNLAFFSVTATAFPHVSQLNQLGNQADPNCNQTASNGLGDLVQNINLLLHKDDKGKVFEPRGLISVRGPELGLSKDEIERINTVIGDIFCPSLGESSQGTGFLKSVDGTLITNAHVLIEKNGRDKQSLPSCFWQNKATPFERIGLDYRTLRPLTRDSDSEFNLDLTLVRLKRPVPNARPFLIDTGDVLDVGDEVIMASANTKNLPGLKKVRELIPVTAQEAAVFEFTSEAIVQRCMTYESAKTTRRVRANDLYTNCSTKKGMSGSMVFIRRNGEIRLKAVHAGGGEDDADNTPFTLDKNAPQGMSYSYEIQLSPEITDQMETLQALNDKGRTSIADGAPPRPRF